MTHCTRCGGEAGAHYAACLFTNMLQRWLGDDYPLFPPRSEPAGSRLTDEEIAAIGQQYTRGAMDPLLGEIAKLRADLDAAMDIITHPGGSAEPPITVEQVRKAAATPEVEPDTDWGALVRKIRAGRGWSQGELAKQLGCARSLVGFWETGNNTPGPRFKKKLRELAGDAPKELKGLPRGLVAANATIADRSKTVVAQALEAETQPDSNKWISSPALLEMAKKIDPGITPRMVGLGMAALGYRDKRQIRIEGGGAPTHYRGLTRKPDGPQPEPPLEEQMAQRRAAEQAARAELPPEPPAKPRYRYEGPRPGNEIYPEWRALLEPLWDTPGWSYAPYNGNGGGKPRVTNPQGTSYVIPNTPSDVRAIKNARAALRRLGASI